MKQEFVQKFGTGLLTLGAFASAFLPTPLAAQQAPRPTGQRLVPNVELSFVCIGVAPYTGPAPEPYIDRTLDLDGDPKTTYDQVSNRKSRADLAKNPQLVLRIGDEVVAVLTAENIKNKVAPYIESINGQNIR